MDEGIYVLNMSLGADTAPADVESAVNAAYAKGIVLVAAAGNDGNCRGTGDNVTIPPAMRQ